MNSNSNGKFAFTVTNGGTAAFGGNLYCLASNEQVLNTARMTMTVSDGATLKTGGHLTFGRENSKVAATIEAHIVVTNATLDLGGNLDLGVDETTKRTGYYHVDLLDGSVLKTKRLVVFNDRDDTVVTFDGATMVATCDQTMFIARNSSGGPDNPFVLGAGGLTVDGTALQVMS